MQTSSTSYETPSVRIATADGGPLARVDRLLAGLLRALLALYRAGVSPFLGPACRFHPSCSRYASEAFERYGVARGGALAIRRMLRCHPWNPGGYDPVTPDA